MDARIFEDCYKHYSSDWELGENWDSLAEKHDYSNGEKLRWAFKAERIRRGIIGKNPQEEKKLSIVRKVSDKPRVAVLDIETLPMVCFTWGMYDQNIGTEQVLADTCMLSWAGKFLNESEVYSDILTPKEAIGRNAKRILQSCWDFLSQCDVLIGHNFCGFDNKTINTGFLKYGLPPLKFIIVDTYLVAKQNFRFSSNKMKYINDQLEIRNKIDNDGFPLWRKCHLGDPVALKQMLEYNVGDVPATEELYYKVRPYVRNFNVALYNEIMEYQCPVCGSQDLSTEGHYYTPAGKWESVRCNECKCIARKKTNLLIKGKNKKLLINS